MASDPRIIEIANGYAPCPDCNGEGKIYLSYDCNGFPCAGCDGSGAESGAVRAIERLIEKRVTEERERCAATCERIAVMHTEPEDEQSDLGLGFAEGAEDCALAIRRQG